MLLPMSAFSGKVATLISALIVGFGWHICAVAFIFSSILIAQSQSLISTRFVQKIVDILSSLLFSSPVKTHFITHPNAPSASRLPLVRSDIALIQRALRRGWINAEASALFAKLNETGLHSLTNADCDRLEHLSDLALTDKLAQQRFNPLSS